MLKALLIGINYIDTPSELSGCYNDVINVRRYLQSLYPISAENVKVLSDFGSNIAPTSTNITENIAWLLKDTKPGDKLFLHYSGHGASIRDTAGDEEDHLDETIVPIDYKAKGMITDDYLRENLVEKVPAGVKLFCIFDCCHSGTVLDTHFTYEISKTSYKIQKHPQYKKSAGDVICISGCKDNQTSADTQEPNPMTHLSQAQGALSNILLTILLETKGKISYKKLMYTMCDRLKKNYSQIPQLSSGRLLSLDSEVALF